MVWHFRRITCFPVKRIINKLITRRRKRRLMALMSKTIHIEMKETDPCLLLFLERTRSCGPCVPYWPQLTNGRFSTGQKCKDMYALTDSCHISPVEMVLSTQVQNTFPLKFYLGSIIATPEEKLFLSARYCVTFIYNLHSLHFSNSWHISS